jgi:hypothetical protein
MPSTIPQLLREVDALDRTQAVLVSHFARELARVLRQVERELPAAYATAVGTGARVRLAQLASLYVQIQQLLREAGYPALVNVTAQGRLARQMARQALRLSAPAASYLAVRPRVQALQALMTQDWLEEGQQVARAVWQASVQSAIAQVPPTRLAVQIAPVLERSVRQARSVVDTALSIYSRQVGAIAATEAREPAFVYLGPVDAKLRPFCAARVGRVYTRTQINRMDNGQIPNVFLSAGGHNCRHRFVEISRFSELRDLLGTTKRAPEVETLLQGVRRAA